jgi:hypothetical protein
MKIRSPNAERLTPNVFFPLNISLDTPCFFKYSYPVF